MVSNPLPFPFPPSDSSLSRSRISRSKLSVLDRVSFALFEDASVDTEVSDADEAIEAILGEGSDDPPPGVGVFEATVVLSSSSSLSESFLLFVSSAEVVRIILGTTLDFSFSSGAVEAVEADEVVEKKAVLAD